MRGVPFSNFDFRFLIAGGDLLGRQEGRRAGEDRECFTTEYRYVECGVVEKGGRRWKKVEKGQLFTGDVQNCAKLCKFMQSVYGNVLPGLILG